MSSNCNWTIRVLAIGLLAGCGAAHPAASGDGAAPAALCTTMEGMGTICNGGSNNPGLTGTSENNQGLIGSSTNGRGVYGSSVASEGGYFSSTDGDGMLAYTVKGYAGHFTGGRGVQIDPPTVATDHALTVNGKARLALADAPAAPIPVCGTLDPTSGLVTLTKCDDRLDRLEAKVAALEARLGDGGMP